MPVPLAGCEVATVVVRPDPADRPAGTEPGPPAVLAAGIEPAQPVYARYWLHNAGPAPAGNLPVTVHAAPAGADGPAGERSERGDPGAAPRPVELRLTVASTLADAEWSGLVRVRAGDGWGVEPAAVPLVLPPGGHAEATAVVTPAPDAPAGDHLVEVSVRHAGQTVADIVTVTVPGAVYGQTDPGEVAVDLDTPAVQARPGERAVLRAVVTNRFRSPADAVLWLVGPAETWPLTPVWTVGRRLAADERQVVEFPVEVPADTEPGSWWLLVKLGCAGRIRYTDAVRLTVDPARR